VKYFHRLTTESDSLQGVQEYAQEWLDVYNEFGVNLAIDV
jgi:hypothetical protein